MALGADHVQAAGLTHLLLVLLHHGVIFALYLGDAVAQRLHLGIIGGSLLGRLGDAVVELQQGELPVAPGGHQGFGQMGEGLLCGFGEGAGVEAAEGAGVAAGFR